MTIKNKMSIDPIEAHLFWNRWYGGDFNGMRLGQAWFNYFNLHTVTSRKEELDRLYQLDGEEAKREIHKLFVYE